MTAKQHLRQEALGRRDAIALDERIEAAIALAERADEPPLDDLPGGLVIAGYHPIRSEIDPRPLMDRLRQRGHRLCLPVVASPTTIEFRELVRGAPLVEAGFGTVGPEEGAAVLVPDVLLMPLAAFDGAGNRIGYGAGHYDRYLATRNDAPLLVGLAFDAQKVDAVPAEPHDRALDAVITPQAVQVFD